MKWFGEQWPETGPPAPVCEDVSDRVRTPVDRRCAFCGDPIQAADRGVMMPHAGPVVGEWAVEPVHLGCLLRVIGVVADDGWPR